MVDKPKAPSKKKRPNVKTEPVETAPAVKAAKPSKTITVALGDLHKVCHVCGEVKEDVYRRSYHTEDYQGGCGDSFCWASCDMTSCKGRQNVQACGDCEKQKL